MHFTNVIGLVAATMGTLTCALPVSGVKDIAAPADSGKRDLGSVLLTKKDEKEQDHFAVAVADAKRGEVHKRGGDGNHLWIKENKEKEEEDPFATALAEATGAEVHKRGGDGNHLWIKDNKEKEEEDSFAAALAEAERDDE